MELGGKIIGLGGGKRSWSITIIGYGSLINNFAAAVVVVVAVVIITVAR